MTGVKSFIPALKHAWARASRPLKPRGFSAIEMLVVVALFSVGSLAAAGTYVNFTHLHRRVANSEVLGSEMRFVTEALVRSARNYAINYPTLPATLVSPTSSISLYSLTSATTTRYQRFATSSTVCAGLNGACIGLSTNGGTSWSAITGKNVTIQRFLVYITPTASPFQPTGVGTYNNNNQPRITFFIEASYNTSSTLERVSMTTQTTVSSRVYQR
jgi:prepilin-type N-terminal cleavage/methylation domain-containing protein